MEEKLIDLVTKKLLEKFGAGGHKPGSGSAVAFQGMISAMLLSTVIDLTNYPERRAKYQRVLPELLEIQEKIKSRIYPNLEKLFQDDSDHFDKVISLRLERDAIDRTKYPIVHRQKAEDANAALKIATDLPLMIAQNCFELGQFAVTVFEKGFQAARGDSSVALNGAISVLAGCLAIIELNLTKLPADEWMEKIRAQKAVLKIQYRDLSVSGVAKQADLEKEAEENYQFQQYFASFRTGTLGETIHTDEEMEALVRDFQNKLWIQRDKIWKSGTVTHPMQVVKAPDVVSKVMDYIFLQPSSLGKHLVGDELFEVAGLIDRNQKLISVSRKFPKEVMNFTAAHELGHLILHNQAVLHRDRPLDGDRHVPKDALETQADKFAACFLMPRSAVISAFEEIFAIERISINETTVLALRAGSISAFRRKCQDRYGFAREIAKSIYFAGKSVNSLADIFGVSAGAMALRLIELDLVDF